MSFVRFASVLVIFGCVAGCAASGAPMGLVLSALAALLATACGSPRERIVPEPVAAAPEPVAPAAIVAPAPPVEATAAPEAPVAVEAPPIEAAATPAVPTRRRVRRAPAPPASTIPSQLAASSNTEITPEERRFLGASRLGPSWHERRERVTQKGAQ